VKRFKQNLWALGAAGAVFLVTAGAVYALDAWHTGFRINTETKNVYVGSAQTCYKVTNTSGNSYFIPTKTIAEWSSFFIHLPGGASVGQCQRLPKCGPAWLFNHQCIGPAGEKACPINKSSNAKSLQECLNFCQSVMGATCCGYTTIGGFYWDCTAKGCFSPRSTRGWGGRNWQHYAISCSESDVVYVPPAPLPAPEATKACTAEMKIAGHSYIVCESTTPSCNGGGTCVRKTQSGCQSWCEWIRSCPTGRQPCGTAGTDLVCHWGGCTRLCFANDPDGRCEYTVRWKGH